MGLRFSVNRVVSCRILAAFFIGGMAASSGAWADPELFDTIHPYASYSETTSSNVLDLANSAQAVQVLGTADMADRWSTETVGVGLDDWVGLQHFTGDLNKSRVKFEKFNELDYDGTSAQGNWKWSVGEHVSGNLGASYLETPTTFAYFHELQQPITDVKQQNFDIGWTFHPSWRVVASLTGYELDYQLAAQQPFSRNEYHALTGFDYLTADGSSIGILTGTLRTYFPFPQQFGDDFIVNNNVQHEFKLNVNWNFSGLSTLQFLGGWVQRKYDVLQQDDYRGWNGRLTSNWVATGSSGVTTILWHEIGAIDLLTTVYALNHGVSVAPYWQPTAKINVQGKYAFETHNFAETAQPFGLPVIGTVSKTLTETAILTYQITQHWNVQLSLYHNAQSTSDHSSDFHANGFQAATTFRF